jgi:hypothetical protein
MIRRWLFAYLRGSQVSKASEAEAQIDAPSDTKQLELAPTQKSGQKTIFALAVFALGLNAAAAVYVTSPADFAIPNIGALAELLPHQKASDPVSDPIVTAALSDIQSTQLQHVALLQENSSSLQQNTALLQQDSTALASLRNSITDQQGDVKKISAQINDEHLDVRKISAQVTDEHLDVKKMSTQISTLIEKVDSLQNAMTPQVTSSIPKGRARARLSEAARKKMSRWSKPAGPISVGGAPLATAPAVLWEPSQRPEG